MRKKTFSEEQIALALRDAETGTPVTEVSRSKDCRVWRKGGHIEETGATSRRRRSGHHGTGMVRERSRRTPGTGGGESPVRTTVRAGGSLPIIAIL